jgi:outer membrane biogenesis lipoprotein LolB
MKKFSRAIALLLVGSMLLSGCSMLTAHGRRARAYDRYVYKSSKGRVKQQKRFAARGNTMPVMHQSESAQTTDISGPESVSDAGEQ